MGYSTLGGLGLVLSGGDSLSVVSAGLNAYDLTAFPPAQPQNAPADAVEDDEHFERYTNGTAYFTHNGTDWTLTLFESSDDRKITVRDETGADYVQGSLAGPQNPPTNPTNLDVHLEVYDNALVFFNYLASGPAAGWDGSNITFVPRGGDDPDAGYAYCTDAQDVATGTLDTVWTPHADGNYIFEYSGDSFTANGGISIGTAAGADDVFGSGATVGPNGRIDNTQPTGVTTELALTGGTPYYFRQWNGGGGSSTGRRICGAEVEIFDLFKSIAPASSVNQVLIIDDTVSQAIDLPDATAVDADLTILDVCEITNPDDWQGPNFGFGSGALPAGEAEYMGNFTAPYDGQFTIRFTSAGGLSNAAANYYLVGGTGFVADPGFSDDVFNFSGDTFQIADIPYVATALSLTQGQQVYVKLVTDAADDFAFESAGWTVTGVANATVAVTANAGAQVVAGDIDSKQWNVGDKIQAVPTIVVDPVAHQTYVQPNGAGGTASQITAAIVPGIVELARQNNGGLYNVISESSYVSGGSSPADTEWRNDTVTAFTTFENSYGGSIGSNILDPAYGNVRMRVISTGEVFNIEFTAWQQGGGGGFSFSVGDSTKVPGWYLTKIPRVGEDFQSGNWATEDLILSRSFTHDFAGNIVNYNNVAQNNWDVEPSGSINWSMPTQAGVGSMSLNASRVAYTVAVNDLFNAGAQPTILRVGQNNSGFSVTGQRPSDGNSVTTGLIHQRSTQAAYPNLTGINLRTPGVASGDAVNGYIPKLVNAATGEIEFQGNDESGWAPSTIDPATETVIGTTTNPTDVDFTTTFTPDVSGFYVFTHGVASVGGGAGSPNAAFNVGTTVGAADVYNGSSDRLDAANLEKSVPVKLAAGTEYFVTQWNGGGSSATDPYFRMSSVARNNQSAGTTVGLHLFSAIHNGSSGSGGFIANRTVGGIHSPNLTDPEFVVNDSNGMFVAGDAGNLDKIVIQQAGRYKITYDGSTFNFSDQTISIVLNGSVVATSGQRIVTGTTSLGVGNAKAILDLSVGDELEFTKSLPDSAANVNIIVEQMSVQSVIPASEASVSLNLIPKATADTYISGATSIGTGTGNVNPTDWLIEEMSADGVTKVSIDGRFDHWDEDAVVTITFPAGTIATPISAVATRASGEHTTPVNMEIVNGDTYTINRDDGVNASHGVSFQIIGIK